MYIYEIVTPLELVPAIKASDDKGNVKIIAGERGTNHGEIYNTHKKELIGFTNVDGGFYDIKNKQYLTRNEAYRLISDNNRKNFPRKNSDQLTSHGLDDAQYNYQNSDGVYGSSNW
jgi:hypothetical protein